MIADIITNADNVVSLSQARAQKSLPGGGEYGRGLRPDVRNPVLGLPAAQAIAELPEEHRKLLGKLLRDLSKQSKEKAEQQWRKGKGMMAAYWRVISVYSMHLARAIERPSSGAARG